MPYKFANPNEDDLNLINGLTQGTSQQVAPQLPPAPTMPVMAPTVAPVQQKAVQAPVAPLAQEPSPTKLPGMPSGFGPSEFENYLNTQKQSLDKYGPEEQMALQQKTLQDRDSFSNRLTSGAKGFADAIMQGVAQQGNPGWQNAYDQQQNHLAAEQMDTMRNANQGNLQRIQTGMSLDAMDPKSQLSVSKQQAYAPLFEKLGYPPSALEGMSSANIDNSMSLMAAYGGKEIESMIKQYELQIERTRLQGTLSNQDLQREQEREKARADAAKTLLSKTGNSRFLGVPIPFTSDVTGKEAEDAKKVLMDQMKGGSTDYQEKTSAEHPASTFSEDYYNSLPSGSPYVGPDGKKRIKQ